MEELHIAEGARASVVRAGSKNQEILDGVHEPVQLKGKYKIEHIRDGKVIDVFEGYNVITNAGKNSLLGIMFHADTQITTWYMGLIDNASFSAVAAADTPASHSGWIENTDYSESVRQTWTVGAASAQAITNASPVVFTMNATKTIKGIFVTSLNTKGGTTGTMWNAVAFGTTASVVSGDLIRATYTVSA